MLIVRRDRIKPKLSGDIVQSSGFIPNQKSKFWTHLEFRYWYLFWNVIKLNFLSSNSDRSAFSFVKIFRNVIACYFTYATISISSLLLVSLNKIVQNFFQVKFWDHRNWISFINSASTDWDHWMRCNQPPVWMLWWCGCLSIAILVIK